MSQRRVVSDHDFDRQVEQLGGYERLDPVLFPIVDSLYADPEGAFLIWGTDWAPLCRYICTKPTYDLPSFVVIFTIEEDELVVLREIEPLEAY